MEVWLLKYTVNSVYTTVMSRWCKNNCHVALILLWSTFLFLFLGCVWVFILIYLYKCSFIWQKPWPVWINLSEVMVAPHIGFGQINSKISVILIPMFRKMRWLNERGVSFGAILQLWMKMPLVPACAGRLFTAVAKCLSIHSPHTEIEFSQSRNILVYIVVKSIWSDRPWALVNGLM